MTAKADAEAWDAALATVLATLGPDCTAKCVTMAEVDAALLASNRNVIAGQCGCSRWLVAASGLGEVCPICWAPIERDRRVS